MKKILITALLLSIAPFAHGATLTNDGFTELHENSTNWSTVHGSTGTTNTTATTINVSSQKQSNGQFRINKGFFDFTETEQITEAALRVYVNSKLNGDNDGDDFIVVTEDDTDIEISNRIDIGDITAGAYNDFVLNSTGISYINGANDFTLSLREGHDVLDNPYAGSNNTKNRIVVASSENSNAPQFVTTGGGGQEGFVGYDIILLAGQSNMFHGLANTADTIPDLNGLDAKHPDIDQLKQDLSVASSTEPLDHNDSAIAGKVGFGLTFAKWYAENELEPNRKVLLVPSAVGSTGFSDNNWNENDPLYNNLVTRVNYAKGLDLDNEVVMLKWHQGEDDKDSMTKEQYETAFLDMVSALETDISEPNLPVVVGGLMPFRVNNPQTYSGYDVIDSALKNLPNLRDYTGYADPQSPTVIANESGTNQTSDHYSARATRGYPTHDFYDVSTLGFAGRYVTAYQEALTNITAPQTLLCYYVTVNTTTGDYTNEQINCN